MENNHTQLKKNILYLFRPDRQAEKGKRRKSGNAPESPVNPKQWKHDCNELLNQMMENKNSEPFRLVVKTRDRKPVLWIWNELFRIWIRSRSES